MIKTIADFIGFSKNSIALSIALEVFIFIIASYLSSMMFFALSDISVLQANPWTIYSLWPYFVHRFEMLGLETIVKFVFSNLVLLLVFHARVYHYKKKLIGQLEKPAKFMSYLEARKVKLFSDSGIFIGKKWGRYLKVPGWEHVICFAPSGTGKTTAVTIPNLLTWDESCVCADIKLELYKHTAQYREKCGHKCYLWNPSSQEVSSHKFNPLEMAIKNKANRIDELHKIATILIPSSEKSDPIWVNGPRNLFMAISLIVLDTEKTPNTIGEVVRTMKGGDNFDAWAQEQLDLDITDEYCKANLHEYLSMPDVTRGGVFAALSSQLSLFENPIIDRNTSQSDFDITSLRKEKTTIYVGITNDNLERLSPLMNLFFQQVLDVLTRKEPNADKEIYGVLMLLDEFTALGKLNILKRNIGLLRSYKVRVLMIIQDVAQLVDTYGPYGSKSFLNVKVKLAFTQSSFEDSKYLSDLVGGKRPHPQNNLSITSAKDKKLKEMSLMPISSILRMSEKYALAIVQGENSLILNKAPWFLESKLAQRVSSNSG